MESPGPFVLVMRKNLRNGHLLMPNLTLDLTVLQEAILIG